MLGLLGYSKCPLACLQARAGDGRSGKGKQPAYPSDGPSSRLQSAEPKDAVSTSIGSAPGLLRLVVSKGASAQTSSGHGPKRGGSASPGSSTHRASRTDTGPSTSSS